MTDKLTEPTGLTCSEEQASVIVGMTYDALRSARNTNPQSVPRWLKIGGRVRYITKELEPWLYEKSNRDMRLKPI